LTSYNFTGFKLPQTTNNTAYIGGSGVPKKFTAIQGLRFELDYEEIDKKVEVLPNTIEVPLEGVKGHVYLYDETQAKKMFEPTNFHFHSPSEHTFDGKHYDLEMHIVNKNREGTAATVVAVYFDTKVGGATENEFLKGL
jgi:carbonic anhydrase